MTRQNSSVQAIKAWVFPGLVSILGMMIWHDVNEVKQDVKVLMAQSNIDKTRIDNLERAVFKTVAADQIVINTPFPPGDGSFPPRAEMVAVLPDNRLTIKKNYETYY